MRTCTRSVPACLKAICFALGFAFFTGTWAVEGLLMMLDGSMELATENIDRSSGDTEEERGGKEKEDDDKSDKLLVRPGSVHPGSYGYGCMPTHNGERLNGHRPVLLRPPLA